MDARSWDECKNAAQLGVEKHGVLVDSIAIVMMAPAGAGDGLLSRDLSIGVPSAL